MHLNNDNVQDITDDDLEQFTQTYQNAPGLLGVLSVVNNQPLGIRFMLTAFAFFLIGGVLALLMRIQLAYSENTFMGPELYNQLFTMHGSTMMYLFSVPFLEGLALYLIPLMIGSRDVAYPRLSAFAYWTYLFGGIIFYMSFFLGAIPDAGWFAYTPLSSSKYSGMGVDFWALGLSLVEVSGIVAGIEIVVTILKFRAPGMSLNRMPIFAWTLLAAGLMSLFAFTTLLIATLMLELDRTAGTQFFNEERGGTGLLWQHLFWFFGHPEVYIIFLPATGIVSMVVATFSKRLLGYTYITVAVVVTAFVSFGLWVHHMYTTGLPGLSLNFFAAASLMIALASGAQVFAWIATLWGQRPALKTPLLFVLGFIFIFVLGGMTGVMIAIVPFDWQVHDTYFIVAHFHYVLIGGAVFPIMAGMYYWIPKFSGRMPNAWLGQLTFWLIFVGFNVTFFPMHIMGFFGMARRVYTYPVILNLDGHNMLSTVGAFIFGSGYLIFIADILLSFKKGRPAGENPWGSDSLEWSISSPPPAFSFLAPPVAASRHPLWLSEQQTREPESSYRAAEALTCRPLTWRATLTTDAVDATPRSIQYLPGPSYFPLIVSIGLVITFLAILFKVYLVAILGIAISVGGLFAWLKPNKSVLEILRKSDLSEKAGIPIFVSGSRSTAWCGMVCALAVFGTALGAMLYAYFYIRLYSQQWPQDDIRIPDISLFAIGYGALACVSPMLLYVKRAFAKQNRTSIQLAFTAILLLVLIYLSTSLAGMLTSDVSPQQTAYGSLFYLLNIYPWLLAIVGLFLIGTTQHRMWREYRDSTGYMLLMLQITSLYWHFVALVGIVIFSVYFVLP